MVHRMKYTPSLEKEFKHYAWTSEINQGQIKWNQIEVLNQQKHTQYGKQKLT